MDFFLGEMVGKCHVSLSDFWDMSINESYAIRKAYDENQYTLSKQNWEIARFVLLPLINIQLQKSDHLSTKDLPFPWDKDHKAKEVLPEISKEERKRLLDSHIDNIDKSKLKVSFV